MKQILFLFVIWIFFSCDSNHNEMKEILFLHHSTGNNIWLGNTNPYVYKLTRQGDVQKFFRDHNSRNNTNYKITDRYFPQDKPYGWNNYPYDYYNIWVKNSGENPYLEEPTLEILTKQYEVIIFKHCFPGSRIAADTGTSDINSELKTLANYKLQYNALKQKMHEFPENKFIIWTPAVCTKNEMTEDEAKRANEFYNWIIEEWDAKDDNIFIWDFYKYETEGDLYLQDKYAAGPNDSHPNRKFSAQVAPLFGKFIIDVIQSEAE